jgi:hypothetical protein
VGDEHIQRNLMEAASMLPTLTRDQIFASLPVEWKQDFLNAEQQK